MKQNFRTVASMKIQLACQPRISTSTEIDTSYAYTISDNTHGFLLTVNGKRSHPPPETLLHLGRSESTPIHSTAQNLAIFQTRSTAIYRHRYTWTITKITNNGNTHVDIIEDRYRKLTGAIKMQKTTAGLAAAAFINNWILVYGIQDSILTANGAKFDAKLFKKICHVMGIKRSTSAACHPHKNGRADRYNKQLPRDFVTACPNTKNDWDRFV